MQLCKGCHTLTTGVSQCMLEATAARNTVADVLLINQSSGSNTLGCCIGKACKLASISVAANFNHANC